MSVQHPPTVLGRAAGPHGETVLRRRGDVVELVVDGTFTMDTADTSTEAELARLTLDRLARSGPAPEEGWRVAVGGLGLGVTTGTLLADGRVGRIELVELDVALAGWVRAGLVPGADGLLDDARVRLHLGDVADVLPAMAAGSLDAVLLDVDNGPDFLVHAGNARIYTGGFLGGVANRLRPGGVLAVWAADPAPALQEVLGRVCAGGCEEVRLPVTRGRRSFEYAVYLGTRT